MIRFSRVAPTPRLALLATCAGLLSLILAACGGVQTDPPGQNSGSAQNAPGAFNFDTTHMVKGAPGTAVQVYDAYTTVTIAFTVTSVAVVAQPANQNAGEVTVPDGERYIQVNVALRNTANSATGCPFPGAETIPCTEFPSPLTNFRLVDSKGRTWPTTTGAAEQCSDQTQAANKGVNCANRAWVNMLGLDLKNNIVPQGGIKPGATFNGTLFFVVPSNINGFNLFYAPYRFPQVTAASGNGNPVGTTTVTAGTGTPTKPATTATTTPATTPSPAPTQAANPGSGPATAEPLVADISFNI